MVEKIKGMDMTEFEGPADTGDAHSKRPADKKNIGDMQPDETVSKSAKKGTELPGTTTVGEEVAALFGDVEGLSEDFVERASTIFEGAISEKVSVLREQMEEEFNTRLDEAYAEISEDLEVKLDQYLNLFVETYLEENKLELEKGFRTELAEAVLENVVSIVEAANIDLSEEKVDVANALVQENEELTQKYNDSLNENVELKNTIRQYQIRETFESLTSDLSEGARDRLRSLTENIEFKDVEQFKRKIEVLKESFIEGIATADKTNLTEVSGVRETNKEVSPRMSKYIEAARGSYFK